MKILVTGANGYIGSQVTKQLCDIGITTIANDIINTNIDKRAIFIQKNIFEKGVNWYETFLEPDVCIHLAWRDGFIHNSENHKLDLPFHISFIKNLVEHGIKKICTLGSMHEIGYYVGCASENIACHPLNKYGEAKVQFREKITKICDENNCILNWLRVFYIYGNDALGNSVFSKLKKASLRGEKKFPLTTGKNMYDFIDINSLSKQIIACAIINKEPGIINCCSGVPLSLKNMLNEYIKNNNLKIELEYGAYQDRPYDSSCIYGDSTKIEHIMQQYNQKIN